MIERALGLLESEYGSLIPLVRNMTELSMEQFSSLAVFIGALRSRTPSQLEHWQGQWAELERIHGMVEPAHTGQEADADQRFWMKEETAKRQMFMQASAYADVVGPTGWIISNNTRVPYSVLGQSGNSHVHLSRRIGSTRLPMFPHSGSCATV